MGNRVWIWPVAPGIDVKIEATQPLTREAVDNFMLWLQTLRRTIPFEMAKPEDRPLPVLAEREDTNDE